MYSINDSYCSSYVHKALTLGFIGIKSKKLNVISKVQLADMLLSAAIKGVPFTLYDIDGTYLISDLINIATDYLYETMKEFFYPNSNLNLNIIDNIVGKSEKDVFFYFLENEIDYKYLNNKENIYNYMYNDDEITPLEIYYSLTSGKDLHPHSFHTIQDVLSEKDIGFKRCKLIKKVVKDYKKHCS